MKYYKINNATTNCHGSITSHKQLIIKNGGSKNGLDGFIFETPISREGPPFKLVCISCSFQFNNIGSVIRGSKFDTVQPQNSKFY